MVGKSVLNLDKITLTKKIHIGCLCKAGVNVQLNVEVELKPDNWYVLKEQKENHVLVNQSKLDLVTYNLAHL